MNKETLRNVRKTAWMTAVGAAEGAAIGFWGGVPYFGIGVVPGSIAGALIGGGTALTTEIIGRIPKRDIVAVEKTKLAFTDTKLQQRLNVTAKVKEVATRIPLIEVPDTIFRLHVRAFDKATGVIKKWKIETKVGKNMRATDVRNLTYFLEHLPSR